MDPSARLLRLLSLLQSRPRWPAAELAERLEVDRRTIRRDVARLRSLGYPVESEPGIAGYQRRHPIPELVQVPFQVPVELRDRLAVNTRGPWLALTFP